VVRWIEREPERFRGRERVTIRSAPLAVADALARDVYPHLKGLVLTSATLAVDGSLRFVEERLGLDRPPPDVPDGPPPQRRPIERALLASPFDFPTQALLAIPTDVPEPSARGFEPACNEALVRLAGATEGSALFLFTSHRHLREAYAACERRLKALGLEPLVQGHAGRRTLMERMRAGRGAVLFGTDAFWEGVDLKGDLLRLVVVVRLPFRSPSDPLQAARTEALEREGRRAFTHLSLPQAVLKLKQGFGRLIRSQRDRGAVVVLDGRILSKPYGATFLESLPPAKLLRAPLAELLPWVRSYAAPLETAGGGLRRD
jgi:ATP-dependent DNA helicase DinG